MMTTLVVGASENPDRYSFKAAHMLKAYGFPFMLYGPRKGEVAGVPIQTELPAKGSVHTLTLYVGPQHQKELMPALLALAPQRVIFNPGTENPDFEEALNKAGIDFEAACTLVLLQTGQYGIMP